MNIPQSTATVKTSLHHHTFGAIPRFIPVPQYLVFNKQITAPLFRYICAYAALRWSADLPVPLNRQIARELDVSDCTVERLGVEVGFLS